jgi:hypothetical protein
METDGYRAAELNKRFQGKEPFEYDREIDGIGRSIATRSGSSSTSRAANVGDLRGR